MRFKLPLTKGSSNIMPLNVFVVLLVSSIVFASPLLLKPELEIQNSNSEVETSFYIISDASASIENVEWCIIPADTESDVDFESDLVLGSRDFDAAEVSPGPHPVSPDDGTGLDDNNDPRMVDILDNDSPPNNVKRDTHTSVTHEEDHVAQLFADVLEGKVSLDKVKRHNWAMICYNLNPKNLSGGGHSQVSITNRCRSDKGYTCNFLGKLSKKAQDDNCDFFCTCKNLFPVGSCIRQAVAPWINCLKVRAAEIKSGTESFLAVRSIEEVPPTSAAANTVSSLVERLFEKRHTYPSTDDVEVLKEDLLKRHNWAFVCYIITVHGEVMDRAFTDNCIRTYGYSCLADGRKYATKPTDGCDGGCKCVDLYPKNKVGGIRLDVNGAIKYVSKHARDLDSALKDDLAKRHNQAFVCYDTTSQGSAIDRAFTDYCIQTYGYSCLGDGKKFARTINQDCDIECKCVDIYPKDNFGAIRLDIHGVSKYVSKARDPDSDLESSELSHDKLDGVQQLVKRHKYALACYETSPERDPNTLLDGDFTNICINSHGYSCSSNGKITKKTTFEFCEDDCRCINLYPKQSSRAIVLKINGLSRYVSKARDLDATNALPTKDVTITLWEEGLTLPSKRHNNAVVCYDEDPFANPKTAQVDTTKARDCLSKGFTCSAGDDGGKMFRTKDSTSPAGDCYNVCRCENLYPKNNFLKACAIMLTVQDIRKCVNRQDIEFLPGSDIPKISLTKNETDRLNARHNFALSCYDRDARNKFAIIDTETSRDCLNAGFNCNSEGKLQGKVKGTSLGDLNCFVFCSCRDLYPKSNFLKGCAIALTVAGVRKCVSRRDLGLTDTQIPRISARGESLAARHNYALSCYDRPPNNQFANVDTVLSRKCLDAGVNCNSDGKLTTPLHSPINCYLYCNCQDLFPKSNFLKSCAIALTVAGVKKCVSRRDLDLDADTQSPKITARDNTDSLVARHNYALSCYNENPWFNPLTARIDTRKSKACLAEGFNCDGEGTLHENENPSSFLNCHEDCRCENLYPKSNFLRECAIALTVLQYRRCVSRRDHLSIGADSQDVSISPRDSPEVEIVTVPDLTRPHEANVDSPVVNGDDDLQRHHKFALVCTKIDKLTLQKSIDNTLSRTCLSFGYSCNSDGKKITKTFDELCDAVCKCENRYPKDNLLAYTLRIVAQGVSRCVSRLDVDTYIGLGDTSIERADEQSGYPDAFLSSLEVAETTKGDGSTALQPDTLKDDAAIDQPKMQRRDDTVQLNTTAQDATGAADDTEASTYQIDCQDHLMTLRCLFEIGGYSCRGNGQIWSIWNNYAPNVHGKELWIQTDWRTCNCVCTCVSANSKRDNNLELPTPEEVQKRIHGYDMQCDDTSSKATCTTSRYFCDHQGGLRFDSSGSQSSVCEASCRCVDPKSADNSAATNSGLTSSEGLDASESKVGLTRRKLPKFPKLKPKAWVISCKDNNLVFKKECETDKKIGCTDGGKLHAEAGGNVDPDCQAKCICKHETVADKRDDSINNVEAIEAKSDQQPAEEREHRGEYVMECGADLTRECAGTDLVRCSRMGIIHTQDNSPVDDACALNCRCVWKLDEVVPAEFQQLPALFYHDATFKSTRHSDVVRRISRRQQEYYIGDKTHECDSLLYGRKQWTLLCQEQPGDDYYTLTTRCADEGAFWCSYGDSTFDPTYRAGAPGYIKNKCIKTCICYSRYEPTWLNVRKRDIPPMPTISMDLLPPYAGNRKMEATTMRTVTVAAK